MQAQNLPNLDEKLNSLQQELLSSEKYSDEQISALKHNFSHFKSQIKKKWLQVHKKEDVFLSKYKSWLEGGFELTVAAIPKRCGRPQKHFSDSGERSKRRKTAELRSTVKDKNLIMHAASVELIKSGKRDASKVLKDIQNSPIRATKYKKAFSNTRKKEIHSLSPMQALKMMIDADLTSAQYEVIRNTCKKIFPCYTLIQKAKNELYPPTESIRITCTSAECDLQPLVDVTVKRLLTYLEVVLSALAAEARNKHFRTYRQDFARKFSRENCNRDIFNRLFLSSDPLFSSTRNVKRGKLKSYLPETLSLLIPAQPNESDSSDNENL